MSAPSATEGTAKARYAQLDSDRLPYLRRARAAAALTIPSLIVPDGHTPTSELPTPYQSFGARGVNNLAARTALTLFPPGTPFHKLTLSEDAREQAGASEGEVAAGLARAERMTVADLEASAYRGVMVEALKHLLVAGQFGMFWPETGRPRLFPLTHFVVLRSPSGRLLEAIVQEKLSWAELEDDVVDQLVAGGVPQAAECRGKVDKTIDVYTHVRWQGKRVIWHQEVENVVIEGSVGNKPADRSPWMFPRLMEEAGSSYSRGYVEDYIGDLKSLEALRESIVNGALAASWMLLLLNPGSTLTIDDIRTAASGSVLYGTKEDLTAAQLDKIPDLAFVESVAAKIEEALAHAFLLNSAIQRNGERVTAEEIRYMADELETQLGGLYSTLAYDLQIPVVQASMGRLESRGRLPRLPSDLAAPTIVTGAEALGRGNDITRLRTFASVVQETYGPEVLAQNTDPSEFMARLAAGLNIVADGLVKTAEQVEEDQDAAAGAAMLGVAAEQSIAAGAAPEAVPA